MKILYVHAMLGEIGDRTELNLVEVPLIRVPEDILQIVRSHEAFRESVGFGARGLVEPEEYEKLVLEDENVCRTFEYFNKGISYMRSYTEKERPVFQAFAHSQTLQHRGHI